MFANNYQRYQTRVGQSLLPSMDANVGFSHTSHSTILRTNAGFNGNGTICEGIPRKSVHESEDDGISIVLRSKMSNMKEVMIRCIFNIQGR